MKFRISLWFWLSLSLVFWWFCLFSFAEAGEGCWQDSAQYRRVIAISDSPVHQVDAAVLYLNWYRADQGCITLVYCNGADQAPHAVVVVSMKGGFEAIEPRIPLFAYADSPQGAIEELWGGEKLKVKYFSWR